MLILHGKMQRLNIKEFSILLQMAAEIRAARNKADDLKEEYDLADKALTNLGDLDDYIQDLKDECTETKANAKTHTNYS